MGRPKETDRIKDLSYEESIDVLIEYQQKELKHILLQKILKDDITGKKKKQKSATEAFSKTSRELQKAKVIWPIILKVKSCKIRLNSYKKNTISQLSIWKMAFDENKYSTLIQEAIAKISKRFR